MTKDVNLEFGLVKKKDETINYLLEETKYNELVSKKNKNTCRYFNYVEHLLVSASNVTACVSIFTFTVELKICVITARIKKYKSIIKKKREKHDKMALLKYPS